MMAESGRPSQAPGMSQLGRKIGVSSGRVTRHLNSIKKTFPLFDGAASPSNVTALEASRDKLLQQKGKVDGPCMSFCWREAKGRWPRMWRP